MESNFFSGSENLYKYLVTIGMLLVILAIYYPLKEKQELEIQRLELLGKVEEANIKIRDVQRKVEIIKQNNTKDLEGVKKMNFENKLLHAELLNQQNIIETKENHINYFNAFFWIFFPVGVVLIIYGFYKWYKAKKNDDEIALLQKRKLELEINKME